MSAINARLLHFDAGIERIIHSDVAPSTTLPERGALPPSGEPVRLYLDEILHTYSWDQQLREFIRPRIENKALLTPGNYTALLDSSLQNLTQFAKQAPPEWHEKLAQATALLAEEQQLRALLTAYRSLLMRA